MRIILAFTLAACTAVPLVRGQQADAAKPVVSGWLIKLKSNDWTERSDALEAIRSDPAALRSQQIQAALLDLLDRENRDSDEALRKAQTAINQNANRSTHKADGPHYEGYGEYCSWLSETVDSFADWNDPRPACVLVNSGYVIYPPSPREAAARAKAAMPCILQMSMSDLAIKRAIAAPMLVEALAKARDFLDASVAKSANQAVLRNLLDPDEGVRLFTVDALGKFGGTDMISPLKDVAERDPSPEVEGNSIRKSAAEAIAEIQKRVGQH
jgi:hypothetical protein